jgi:hypothetical protein
MDLETYQVLSKLHLSCLHLIALADFEKGDEGLRSAKQKRSRIEYYFTCTPSLPLFILENYPAVDLITYLDADLLFFADPEVLYGEMANHSVAITGHHFPPYLRVNEKYGVYNVGWVSFRRDPCALSCLRWWRERCLDWCYDRVEEGKFADQKYLDEWPSRFGDVVVLRHKGANLAPWNLASYTLVVAGDHVLIDRQPLIFFHYHGFKMITSWLYDPNLAAYKVRPSRVLLQRIYGPYVAALAKATEQVSPLLGTVPSRNGIRDEVVGIRSPRSVATAADPANLLEKIMRPARRILTRSYIVTVNGHVI